MTSRRESEEKAGIGALFRETTDGFSSLVAAHVKVANLELAADLHSTEKRLLVLAAIGVVSLVGYVLLMLGVALLASSWVGRPLGFILVGTVHLAVASIAAVVIAMKKRQALQVTEAIASVGQSVTALEHVVVPSSTPSRSLERPHVRA